MKAAMNSTRPRAEAHHDRTQLPQHPAPDHDGHGHGALPSPENVHQLRQLAVMLARNLARGQFDPEDLAHEALERWLRCASHQAPIASPRAWFLVVLRRLLVDRLRRRRAAAEVPADYACLPVLELDPAPWWREIEVGAVRRELGCLPPALRKTFELFTFGARSYQQIARELNIAEATVGTRISRARARLKQQLLKQQLIDRHVPRAQARASST
jgi:RNA polymerase sigma-70 factor (ECF subfamily)